MASSQHSIPDDVLVRAIVAHRRVLPDAYAGVGLTVREEGAMKDALLCAYGSLFEQLEALRETLAELERATTDHANEHGCSGDLGARLYDARRALGSLVVDQAHRDGATTSASRAVSSLEAVQRGNRVLVALVRDAEEHFLQIMEPERDVQDWLARVEVAEAIGALSAYEASNPATSPNEERSTDASQVDLSIGNQEAEARGVCGASAEPRSALSDSSPASSLDESLAQADRDLAEGRARPASEVFADLDASDPAKERP